MVLAGAILRIWGIHFGMPILSNFYIRPDESLLVEPSIHFFERWGDPRFYVYPGLVISLSGVLSHGWYAVASAAGWTTAATIVEDYAIEPSPYFMVTRWISAAAGVATIYLVYRLSLQLSRRRELALLAALLYAFAPLAVRDAHFGVTDCVMVLFLIASLIAAIHFATGETDRATAMGGWLGLAASSKYTGLLVAPRLVWAVITRRSETTSRRRLLAALAGVTLLPAAIFVLLNPYAVLNWRATLAELLNILEIFYLWQPGDPPWTPREAILQVLRPLRFGPGGLAGLALCGLGIAISLYQDRRTRTAALVPAGFLLLQVVALLPFRHLVPYRYLLPVLPLIAIFAAHAGGFLLSPDRRRMTRWTAGGLISLCLGFTLYRSIQMDALLASRDTRTLAGEWIESRTSPEVPVVILCPPEAELQLYEHRDSVLRRTEYVGRRYGEAAGLFISRLYLDQLADLRRRNSGRQLFRFPEPSEFEGRSAVIVTCDHPLRMGRTPAAEAERWTGEVLDAASFSACVDAETAAWDWIDAAFLPFNQLDRCERPGPNLEVRLMHLGAASP